MTDNLIAFHSDPTLKAMMLEEIAWHRAQDKIVQGVYGEDDQYCAVGCSIHSLNRRKGTDYEYSDHSVYETELGIPRALARLQDGLFESLPSAEALDFPLQFMSAITPGADLSLVVNRFLVWMLTDPDDGVIRFAAGSQRIRDAINRVAELHQGVIDGVPARAAAWDAAGAAAWAAAGAAAWAADDDAAGAAARAAAWAADDDAAWAADDDAAWDDAGAVARAAAGAAAGAAAWAADDDAARAAARAAAWAADDDAARAAARAAAVRKMVGKLLDLLSSAPVPVGSATDAS